MKYEFVFLIEYQRENINNEFYTNNVSKKFYIYNINLILKIL